MAIRKYTSPLIAAVTSLLFLCVSASQTGAQTQPSGNGGTTSANFLRMDNSARASALGGAFVAIADDATAGYWNPAGLPLIEGVEIIFMHNSWYQDISSNFFGLALPVSHSVAVGLDVSYLDYGSFEGYDGDDQPTGEYSAHALVISSSGALRVSRHISFGMTGKVFSEKLDRSSASGCAVSLGALYRASCLSVGASLKNLGTGLRYDLDRSPLPRDFVLGLAISAYEGRLRLASDFGLTSDEGTVLRQGLEYCYENAVFLRTGYSHAFSDRDVGGSTVLTIGFGVRHSIGTVDYSYMPGDRLEDVHRISFRLNFGKVNR